MPGRADKIFDIFEHRYWRLPGQRARLVSTHTVTADRAGDEPPAPDQLTLGRLEHALLPQLGVGEVGGGVGEVRAPPGVLAGHLAVGRALHVELDGDVLPGVVDVPLEAVLTDCQKQDGIILLRSSIGYI